MGARSKPRVIICRSLVIKTSCDIGNCLTFWNSWEESGFSSPDPKCGYLHDTYCISYDWLLSLLKMYALHGRNLAFRSLQGDSIDHCVYFFNNLSAHHVAIFSCGFYIGNRVIELPAPRKSMYGFMYRLATQIGSKCIQPWKSNPANHFLYRLFHKNHPFFVGVLSSSKWDHGTPPWFLDGG